MVSDVGVGTRVGGEDNRQDDVANSGGNVRVAGGGARWWDCCKFPYKIFAQFLENLSYRLLFTFNINIAFLWTSLERKAC